MPADVIFAGSLAPTARAYRAESGAILVMPAFDQAWLGADGSHFNELTGVDYAPHGNAPRTFQTYADLNARRVFEMEEDRDLGADVVVLDGTEYRRDRVPSTMIVTRAPAVASPEGAAPIRRVRYLFELPAGQLIVSDFQCEPFDAGSFRWSYGEPGELSPLVTHRTTPEVYGGPPNRIETNAGVLDVATIEPQMARWNGVVATRRQHLPGYRIGWSPEGVISVQRGPALTAANLDRRTIG